jgi:protease-4
MRRSIEIGRRIGRNATRALRRGLVRLPEERFWLDIGIGAELDEIARPRLAVEPVPGLIEVLSTLEHALDDPSVEGVLVRLDAAPAGWSKVQSLRRALENLVSRGVPVVVYAEVLDAESMLLASVATRLYLAETGRIFLVGLRADSFYFRGLLDHLDVRPEVVRIGSHKTAGETLVRDRMSDEQREQVEALLDDRWQVLVGAIAKGRGLSESGVRDLIDRGPYSGKAAVEVGLVDECLYPDAIDERLKALSRAPHSEGPREVRRVDGRVYYVARIGTHYEPLFADGPRIAYVLAEGTIRRGEDNRGIGSDSLGALLDGLRQDARVQGVVLRVDSPGGDALASDLLWRILSRIREEKPLVASMSEVAASGGYYLACAADHVLAEPCTVTGSIGVIGGKLDLAGLYERLGVGRDAVERGARAGLLSETRGFTDEEREALESEMGELYGAFVDRVAKGRGLAAEAVLPVAGGRVWSGVRAQMHGLVDELGGPLEALAAVRRLAGIEVGEPSVLDIRPHRPRLPALRGILTYSGSH